MTPDDLRALAARVMGEEPSDELRDAVLIALGWKPPDAGLRFEYWSRPHGTPCHIRWLPNPLTSHDAAFWAMPAGWRIWEINQTNDGFAVRLYHADRRWPTPQIKRCFDLPRALTAAGLLARAAEMEQGDKP